ncbi:hypothetical protein PY092_12550 [Muricauda sp. 334s03]|uniref:DUF4340 domain-containing protein n=1 Tax=Flagellimonas yonaguniensis TaxID=3031325 RepID=A0ABT5Y0Y0_9FLAO|nr:hypothetical protein [[Muricauda] yonaguniensis]MDF0716984.1 hypothetical protein [[Muricauda] yonaguniensis]
MRKGKTAMKLLGATSLGMGLVIILFLSSESQVHRNNAFIRRYPPHPVIKQYDLDLGFNSYYFAGFDQNILYLGNYLAPWHVLEINLNTKDTFHIKLVPTNKKLQFRSLMVKVKPPYFFIMDGTVPFILRGKIGEWKAFPWMEEEAFFTKALPLDSNKIYVRTQSASTQKSTLGIIKKTSEFQVLLDTTILQQQVDGIFDVDGIMVKSPDGQHTGYVYYYRNEFMLMDSELGQLNRQRTIDTVQSAQIQVAKENRKGMVQMKSPSLLVNKAACLSEDLMLIESDRLGKNDNLDGLEQSTIIDVYNHKKRTYEFSLHLDHIKKEKVKEFSLYHGQLMALIGNQLSVYKTVDHYFKKENNTHVKNTTGQ